MKNTGSSFRNTLIWGVSLITIGGAIAFYFLSPHYDAPIRGDQPYQLTPQELSILRIESEKGDCAAAYKVAQYHLYSSLDLQQAEKYYRLAAKCPNPDALTGLIIVLRQPENDRELDELVVALKKLDLKMGESAAIEVAHRRAQRTLR